MRIVLIGPVYPYRGGIAHYTTRLYQTLCERKHDVLLVSFKRQYPRWLFPGQSDRDPSRSPLEVERAQPWIDSLNPFTWLATFWRIRQRGPDLIVMQWWTTFWAPAWFVFGTLNRLFLHRPVIYICHNVLPHESRWWDLRLARGVLGWGTRFIVQSKAEKEQLLALIPSVHVDVVPHPIYDMFAPQRIPKEDARRQLGLPQGVPVLLFFGIVRNYKGLQDLLEALPTIRSSLKQVTLVVAGEFWEDQRPYREAIRRLGLKDSVLIVDRYIPNEEVAIYFSAADLLVAPYRQVTGSGAVQMARGFGLPVVTTDIVEATQAAGDETNLRVPPADPNTLATAVVRFFNAQRNPPLSASAPRAQQGLSWEDLARTIETPGQGSQP